MSKVQRNWERGARGLGYLQEGLFPFTDRVVKEEHAKIVQNLTPCSSCSIENILPAHAGGISCIQRKKEKCNCRKRRNQYCPTCSNIYDCLVRRHRFSAPLWVTDCSKWYNDHWQFAKVFLSNTTKGTENTAKETDVSGLLSIIINGEFFQRELPCTIDCPNDIFSKVRNVRNEILNKYAPQLTDQELNIYLQSMIAVLEYKKVLYSDPAAQAAVLKLKQISTDKEAEDKEQSEKSYKELAGEITTKEKDATGPTSFAMKKKEKKERSPKDPCIFDGRLIILLDDDRELLIKKREKDHFAEGGFGKVYKCKESDLFERRVVIKTVELTTAQRASANLEIMVSRIRHQFILPLLATFDHDRERWFISPYCENLDLAKAMQIYPERLDKPTRIRILFQLAKAIEYLHTPVDNVRDAIIHKDITSSNILLDDKYNVRLTDFGIAREKNDVTNSMSGKEGYVHPDVKKSPALDIYSFGVVVRELLTGLKPNRIEGKYLQSMKYQNIKDNIKTPFRKDEDISETLNEMSCACLDPKKEIDFKTEVVYILDKSRRHYGIEDNMDPDKCHVCMINPKGRKHSSINHRCINVCVSCEKNSFLNPIWCHCGKEIKPIIGTGWGALLIAGNGDEEGDEDREVFKKDVNDIKNVITSKAPLIMGLSEDKVQTVVPDKQESLSNAQTSPLPEQKRCMHQRITTAIQKMPTDLHTLIIYISCHGEFKDTFTFKLSDVDRITLKEFEELLALCKQCVKQLNKVILLFDCCNPPKVNIPDIDVKNLIQVNACESDKKAYYIDKESVFTKYLIQGLKAQAEGLPCGKQDCKSCKKYWEERTDYVTVVKLLGYIEDHIGHKLRLFFQGNHDDFIIAYYTDEPVLVEFALLNSRTAEEKQGRSEETPGTDKKTARLQLEYFKDMKQIETQLLEEFSKEEDAFRVVIKSQMFRTDKEFVECKTPEKVLLAWTNRQPLYVVFEVNESGGTK